MIYKSGIVGCYGAYDYVKGMIDKIGKVTAFKAYFYDFDPYFEIEDGIKRYYHLILFNENDDEFWIDSNCGYAGTGPSFTKKILELLGVRDDYGINKYKSISKNNLDINNELNLLFVKDNYIDKQYNILLKADFKFETAALRLKMIKFCKMLGCMNNFYKEDDKFNMFFTNNRYDENNYGEYRINNIIFLSRALKNISTDNLKSIIDCAISKLGRDSIEANVKEINEIVEDR